MQVKVDTSGKQVNLPWIISENLRKRRYQVPRKVWVIPASERNKNPGLPWKTGPEKQPVDNYSWRRPIKSDKWTHYWPTVKLVSKWVSKTHYSQGVFSEPLNVHAYTWMGNLGSPRGQGTPLPEWEKTLTSNPPSPAVSLKGVREGGEAGKKQTAEKRFSDVQGITTTTKELDSIFF